MDALPPSVKGSVEKSDDSSLTIDKGTYAQGVKLQLVNRASVNIGENCNLGLLEIYSNGGGVEIGNGVNINGWVRIYNHEGHFTRIGHHCLVGGLTVISTSDMHSIVDRHGRRINYGKDIRIGNRVWIGEHCYILKGATIGDGSIVGACAVVSASLRANENCLIAGNPGRIIKKRVTWDFERLP
jgi:acetyltransferase-like isoleucine patch superfamily enzyme